MQIKYYTYIYIYIISFLFERYFLLMVDSWIDSFVLFFSTLKISLHYFTVSHKNWATIFNCSSVANVPFISITKIFILTFVFTRLNMIYLCMWLCFVLFVFWYFPVVVLWVFGSAVWHVSILENSWPWF